MNSNVTFLTGDCREAWHGPPAVQRSAGGIPVAVRVVIVCMEWHLWPVPTKHQLAMWVNLAVKYGRQASPLKPEIEATNSGKKRCELKSAFQNLPGRKAG